MTSPREPKWYQFGRSKRAENNPDAARQRELERQFRNPQRRTWLAQGLVALALVVAIQHLLAHSGWRPIPISLAKQDLLIGYPTAGLIGLAALFIWGQMPAKK